VLNILGAATAAKIPTIKITTTSSTRLKAERFLIRGATIDGDIRGTVVKPKGKQVVEKVRRRSPNIDGPVADRRNVRFEFVGSK
jgi:hypothetical protein